MLLHTILKPLLTTDAAATTTQVIIQSVLPVVAPSIFMASTTISTAFDDPTSLFVPSELAGAFSTILKNPSFWDKTTAVQRIGETLFAASFLIAFLQAAIAIIQYRTNPVGELIFPPGRTIGIEMPASLGVNSTAVASRAHMNSDHGSVPSDKQHHPDFFAMIKEKMQETKFGLTDTATHKEWIFIPKQA